MCVCHFVLIIQMNYIEKVAVLNLMYEGTIKRIRKLTVYKNFSRSVCIYDTVGKCEIWILHITDIYLQYQRRWIGSWK